MAVGDVTVAVPTKGRYELVIRLLEILRVDAPDAEVLVVDDSGAEDRSRLRKVVDSMPRGRFFEVDGNVSTKRNFAARHASGKVVLFIDSDCEPLPGLVFAHARFWVSAPADAACGLGVLQMVGPEDFWWRVIRDTDLLTPFRWPETQDRMPWGPTANLSVLRSTFLRVGGFDEALSPPRTGGEDVEFGLRLGEGGYVTYGVSDAIASHTTETWLGVRQILRRLWMWGRGDAELLARFPERCHANPPGLLGLFSSFLLTGILLAAATPDLRWLLAAPAWLALTIASLTVHHRIKKGGWTGGAIRLVYIVLDLSRSVNAKSRGARLLQNRFDFSYDDAPVWQEIASDQWYQAFCGFVTMASLAMWIG